MISEKTVCVLGLGYIGLPTAALLANRGYYVHGVDISENVVDTINKGNIHIVEPELDTFVSAAVKSGKLKASLTPVVADVFIIAVPTPFHDDYVPNLDYVKSATKAISGYVKKNDLIILESTSPVGTTELVEKELIEEGVDTSVLNIAHCPERVLPGHIIRELVENDRIVGGLTKQATKVASKFYREFIEGDVLETDARTAEMAKLTENSFRDTNIAFANELSMLCDKFDIDVWELINLANKHPRVSILSPGPGVGGHCIAVDPWFIVHAGKDTAKLIRTSREVNNYKTKWVIEKIKSATLSFEIAKGRKPVVACMGLSFKPDIDDLRESPALYIVRELIKDGLNILAVEPNLQTSREIELVDYKLAIKKADIIVFLVGHREFNEIDIYDRQIIDFCGIKR
ncbi:UDP-N-acetyl-D-mannosamine dehydrogenase [Francisella sp. LA112445]|uniref:UDP-N-acetyl-D-mannosamine dehydrogenase n=1 Tax=Francisella sp. LA112445 TaxID=1395624 RepID=UPI001788D006|nr:UDP-N-acetyl-D-mannosamine dehydrogenase [Francisella sp. LA112445]QIW09650.1 UDP-N-acetyl-D-mannosamine dehydrogenase [Francisella sp. LA112445]